MKKLKITITSLMILSIVQLQGCAAVAGAAVGIAAVKYGKVLKKSL